VDIVDRTGAPGYSYTAYNVEYEKFTDAPPALVMTQTNFSVNEGVTVSFHADFTDTDHPDRHVFSLRSHGTDVFPTGASIDPNTGVFTWVTNNQGTFGFEVVVTDAAGEESAQAVQITVTNVPPSISAISNATIIEGSSF